jgi:hypothetical protein
VITAAALFLYPDRFVLAWHRAWVSPLAPQPALSLEVVGKCLWLALWPATLVADYRYGAALPTASFDGPPLAAVGLAVWIAAGAVLLARGHVAGAGLLWFLVALLPVAQLVPYAEIIAEHNAYLPSSVSASLRRRSGRGRFTEPSRARRRGGPRRRSRRQVVPPERGLARRGLALDRDPRGGPRIAPRATTRNRARPRRTRRRSRAGARACGRGRSARRRITRGARRDARSPRRLRGAARTAHRAIQVSPNAPAYAVLGWSSVGLGKPFAARRAFRKALAIDGTNADAIRGLQSVRDTLRPRARVRTMPIRRSA